MGKKPVRKKAGKQDKVPADEIQKLLKKMTRAELIDFINAARVRYDGLSVEYRKLQKAVGDQATELNELRAALYKSRKTSEVFAVLYIGGEDGRTPLMKREFLYETCGVMGRSLKDLGHFPTEALSVADRFITEAFMMTLENKGRDLDGMEVSEEEMKVFLKFIRLAKSGDLKVWEVGTKKS